MRRAVLDASVAVMWVIPETHSDAADTLLDEHVALMAPSHWLTEVGTTLWAYSAIKGGMGREKAEERFLWLRSRPVAETPVRDLFDAAMGLAFDLHLTVYDALYLALAQKASVPLVTGDRKLFDKAKAVPHLASLVAWVGDLAQGQE